MSFDSLLESVGGVGYFQITLLIAMYFAKFTIGSNLSLPVLVNFERKYTCKLTNKQLNQSAFCEANSNYSSLCTHDNVIFDNSIVKTTIQSQYFLVCRSSLLASLSTSIFFAGFLIGGPFYGILSDRFGRMKTLSLSSLNCLLMNVILSFMPNIWVFIAVKLLHGIGVSGIVTVSNVTFQEFLPANKRLKFQMIYNIAKPIGTCILALFGYFIRNHKHLQLIVASLSVPTSIIVFIFPESPRWLISRGRTKDAFESVCSIAKCNNRNISREQFDQFFADSGNDKSETDLTNLTPAKNERNTENDMNTINDGGENTAELPHVIVQRDTGSEISFRKLLKNKIFLCVSVAIWMNFFSCAVTNTMLLLASGHLGFSVYYNLVLLAFVEILGVIVLIFVGEILGRVPIFLYGISISSILTIIVAIFFKRNEILTVVFAYLCNFFIASLLNFFWVYSFEVFPTPFRNSFTGMFPLFGGVGCIMVPVFIELNKLWKPTSFVISGILLTIGVLLSLIYPETKGEGTPETVEEGLKLFRKDLISLKKLKKLTVH